MVNCSLYVNLLLTLCEIIGIGIQVHESPYLRGGNEALLAIGNVFSNEPGIYIEGQVSLLGFTVLLLNKLILGRCPFGRLFLCQ